MLKVFCANCGATLYRFPSQVKTYDNAFCDKSCQGAYLSKKWKERKVSSSG